MEKMFDKKRRHDVDGEEMLDLGIPCVDVKSLRANGLLRVSHDQRGRIDRFTYANVSKDSNAIDMVMYYNHIFNPFSIDEGDMLYTPVYNESDFRDIGEPVLPDSEGNTGGGLSYAEMVERAAKTGLGIK
jgi:hypothetical protein